MGLGNNSFIGEILSNTIATSVNVCRICPLAFSFDSADWAQWFYEIGNVVPYASNLDFKYA